MKSNEMLDAFCEDMKKKIVNGERIFVDIICGSTTLNFAIHPTDCYVVDCIDGTKMVCVGHSTGDISIVIYDTSEIKLDEEGFYEITSDNVSYAFGNY